MTSELRAMLRLAWPVILAEVGWITMGIVDTIMVAPLGPAALGAVGTGSTMFMALMVFGIGSLFALDTFVSQSYGAGRIDECHRWLFAGLYLAAGLSVVLSLAGALVVVLLPHAGLHPAVLALLAPYIKTLLWSAIPLLAFSVFRRYLQAMNLMYPVTTALVSANLVNLFGNWLFIFGHWGAPAMGVRGSAVATTVARVYMAIFLLVVIWWRERRRPSGLHDVPLAPDGARIFTLAKLGAPAGTQLVLEIGVFAAASMLAARITPIALAANQVVLNVASFTFMIPLGMSSAAAVRVGHAIGRGDRPAARRAGWSALMLGTMLMSLCSVIYVLIPRVLLGISTRDVQVLDTGTTVLCIYAAFQVFDAWQVIGTGALRGLGDTHTPVLLNIISHWIIGLPLAYVLCFNRGWGVAGLWLGLSIGLTLVGVVLVGVWRWRTRHWK